MDWGEALKVTARQDDWLAIEDIEGERGWLHAGLTWGLSAPEASPGEAQERGAKR